MQAGLKQWLSKHHVVLLNGRKQGYWTDQGYNLVAMLQNVRETARHTKKGDRSPEWLQHLVDMIDLKGDQKIVKLSDSPNTTSNDQPLVSSPPVELGRRPLLRRHSTECSSASTDTKFYSTDHVLDAVEDQPQMVSCIGSMR